MRPEFLFFLPLAALFLFALTASFSKPASTASITREQAHLSFQNLTIPDVIDAPVETLSSKKAILSALNTTLHSVARPIDYRFHRHTRIFVSGTSHYKLFINGQLKGSSNNPHGIIRYTGLLRIGTVLSIEGSNNRSRGGLIAAIRIRRRSRAYYFVTGRFQFRIRRAFPTRHTRRLARTRRISSCNWPFGRRVLVPRRLISQEFPFSTRARYVWARGPRRGGVVLRFIVGGDNCPGSVGVPPSPLRCACRRATMTSSGMCFRFRGNSPSWGRVARCEKTKCQRGYECVTKGATARCMKKFATGEVRMVRRLFRGAWICRSVRLRVVRPFLVPYA